MLNEPYQAVLDFASEGVRIKITAEAEEDTDESRAEADRRAKVIADHFRIIIGTT